MVAFSLQKYVNHAVAECWLLFLVVLIVCSMHSSDKDSKDNMTWLIVEARPITFSNVENDKPLEAISVHYSTYITSVFFLFVWTRCFLLVGSIYYCISPI